MDLSFELRQDLMSDNRQKITEIELICREQVERLCSKNYSVDKLKQDECARQFLTREIRDKLLHVERQATHKVIAAR